MSETAYRENFIEADECPRLDDRFIVREVLPRVIEAISDYGDGMATDGLHIHTREIEALVKYIQRNEEQENESL